MLAVAASGIAESGDLRRQVGINTGQQLQFVGSVDIGVDCVDTVVSAAVAARWHLASQPGMTVEILAADLGIGFA